jgi:hypothetical protein
MSSDSIDTGTSQTASVLSHAKSGSRSISTYAEEEPLPYLTYLLQSRKYQTGESDQAHNASVAKPSAVRDKYEETSARVDPPIVQERRVNFKDVQLQISQATESAIEVEWSPSKSRTSNLHSQNSSRIKTKSEMPVTSQKRPIRAIADSEEDEDVDPIAFEDHDLRQA